ncbi:TetR/AcrR family transcriptional regulator [Duganella sp. OV458]|uniref:TetR/AcrR family transcriptional regulator n=2 Tax=unclassified Duganella TaxID=2636909 RepID=UPI000883E9B0|nr:TetR/AcrR family transcriptional regulator [Duganella sp. OV458]SDG36304.1 transcriptional regulator, TetR family [Duganella sp. OV458]SDJ67139.1 transcriptional regulator, TetR family [Duganella sp. OV510]
MGDRSGAVPLLAEVFRTYGFEGASLARISKGTGLGKGSIYNFFPGGKDEMAAAVLDEIDGWFRQQVFQPLREAADVRQGVADMFTAVGRYFLSGRKVCLVGVFALGHERDRFAVRVQAYFAEWVQALAAALQRGGRDAASALALAEEVVGGIQGALVLARAADEPALFMRALERLQQRLD